MTLPSLSMLSLAGLCSLPFAALASAPALPASAVVEQPAELLQPMFGGGFGGFDGTGQGGVFGVVPLVSTLGEGGRLGGSLWFTELRADWIGTEASSQTLGLGFRHLFSQQPVAALEQPRSRRGRVNWWDEGWFVGGNVFLDTLQSAAGFDYWQAGLGLEVGSRYLTLRGNFYFPLNDEANFLSSTSVERWRHTELVGERDKPLRYIERPHATRSDIKDTFVRFERTQTFRTQVANDVFSLYEQGVMSWDTSATLLVPGLDRYTDLRLIGGLYGFGAGDYSQAVQGWRVGAEWRPIQSLALQAAYFDDDRHQQGQWFAGFRVEIPLGKTPAQLAKPQPRRLIERLVEPTGRFAGAKIMHGVRVDRQLVIFEGSITDLKDVQGQTLGSNYIHSGDVVEIIYLPDGRIFEVLRNGGVREVDKATIYVVPEPSRALLLLMGSAALLLRRQRQRRA